MLTRRHFTFAAAAAAVTTSLPGCGGNTATGKEHRILMLGRERADLPSPNVFDPLILRAAPGDRVTFVPSKPGHASASVPGMIPPTAEHWNGELNVALTVTLTEPGVYGYICVPHYHMGMVGVIVVGDNLDNLAEARTVSHPATANGVFNQIFDQLTA
ncbi:MAG: pseudoazurin [Pseudomonadota bacterium]